MDPILAMLVLFLLAVLGFFVILRRTPPSSDPQTIFLSPVSRQHLDAFQGEDVSSTALEKTKNRFRQMLEDGEAQALEKMLQGGLDFLVQVRALTEIGTESAAQILEKTFGKPLSRDSMEQEWFSIDLASGLRALNRHDMLPEMLRYLEENQHGYHHLLAGELICFLSFEGYLRKPNNPTGRLALKALCLALQGIRAGNSPSLVSEARLGDLLEALWDSRKAEKAPAAVNRPDDINPHMALVFHHALRVLKRFKGLKADFPGAGETADECQWQLTRMESLEIHIEEYLENARKGLQYALTRSPLLQHPDYLQAMCELKCPPNGELRKLLHDKNYAWKTLLLECFSFSKQDLGDFLLDWAKGLQSSWGESLSSRKEKAACLASLARCLRFHPSLATEKFLVKLALAGKGFPQLEALNALGWWEPFGRTAVISALKKHCGDKQMETRYAARSALARLGERSSLQWLRSGLLNDDPFIVHQTIHTVSTQGISLLWPELDQLVDAPDGDVAVHAREAIANLSEEL
ncbi:MAG: HEAT repeat domain-containing protein [Gemmataceae bacterium]|nr:HEAT repeat domain-containing protein [Gemmataceae bacterium]